MLNRVVLIGRLTKDPELRYSPNGVAVASFTLAVERAFKNAQGEKETDFIPCVVFKGQAEAVANYLTKGKLSAVDGRIQVRSFEGQDGQRKWVTEILCEIVRFLSPKDNNNSVGSSKTSGGPDNEFSGFTQEVPLGDDIPF